jgi:hypothetical protein
MLQGLKRVIIEFKHEVEMKWWRHKHKDLIEDVEEIDDDTEH